MEGTVSESCPFKMATSSCHVIAKKTDEKHSTECLDGNIEVFFPVLFGIQ